MAADEDRQAHHPSQAISPQVVADAPDGYENLARIDQGGFAVVYRALDTRFDRIVALKILRSDSLDERQLRHFSSECQATGRVSSHPNIVTVYDAGTTAGHRPWLAMEYCSGGSLARKLARTGPLPVAEVISIGARLCSALSAAHEAGILHRDVKPHNVLITSYGEPALADFGIASVVVGEDGNGSATQTAAYTVVHAAPEVVEGKAGTEAADLYSLGSTLYTLLAGQAPFAREATAGLAPLVSRILRNDIPAIVRHGVPPELEQLLRTCMARKPQDRPDSAAQLGASLTSLGLRLSAGATQPKDGARPDRSGADAAAPPISARRLLVLLGGALVVMLAAFTTFTAWGASRPDSSPEVIRPEAMAGTTTETGDQASARTGSARPARSSDEFAPTGLAVTRGRNKGELIVTWRSPISSAVVATVIYEGTGTTKARAIITYDESRKVVPTATVHGLPANQRVCLSAAHVVSFGDKVTNVVSAPVCTVPR